MNDRTLLLDIDDSVAVLRLNRPERRNAMDDDMAEEFAAAITAIEGRSKAKAMVLTGNGPAFCAGGDLEGFPKWKGKEPSAVEAGMREFYAGFLRIMDLPIPTVAAVNGPAIGAGACLATACDVRVASEAASIGFTFVRLGINPGMGAEYLLNRLVGTARAIELLMTGEVLSAADAHRLGLINRVVPGGELMEKAVEMARGLARMPSSVPKAIKKNTTAAAEGASLEEILKSEARTQSFIFTDPGFQEQIREKIRKLKRDDR